MLQTKFEMNRHDSYQVKSSLVNGRRTTVEHGRCITIGHLSLLSRKSMQFRLTHVSQLCHFLNPQLSNEQNTGLDISSMSSTPQVLPAHDFLQLIRFCILLDSLEKQLWRNPQSHMPPKLHTEARPLLYWFSGCLPCLILWKQTLTINITSRYFRFMYFVGKLRRNFRIDTQAYLLIRHLFQSYDKYFAFARDVLHLRDSIGCRKVKTKSIVRFS